MKKNSLFLIASLSILAVSCHAQKTTSAGASEVPANQPETAAVEPNAVNPEVQPQESAAPPADAPTACGIGSKTEGDQCVCGDMKLPVMDNVHWACIGDILRCLRADGCFYKGQTYPQLTEIRKGTAYCGHTQAPEIIQNYLCTDFGFWFSSLAEMFSRFDSDKYAEAQAYLNKIFPKNANSVWWVCNANFPASCKCQGITIEKGVICTADGALASNGGIYHTQEEYNQENSLCGGYYYNDLKVQGKDNLRCFDGKWQPESCYKGQRQCGYELSYTDGAWQCLPKKEWYEANRAILCNGIHVPVKDEGKCEYCRDNPRCEYDVDYRCRYDDWEFDYRCRYGNWVCESDDCECLTQDDSGKEEYITIQYGDICDTSRYYKDEALTGVIDPNWEDSSSICLEGNCPCGNGACPKFGMCKEGHCFVGEEDVGTDKGEFYSTEVFYRDGEYTEDFLAMLVCSRPEGCRTPDGRHYNYRAVLRGKETYPKNGHQCWREKINSVLDNLQFHIDGNPETPDPGIAHHGECILDKDKCKDVIQNHDFHICKPNVSNGHRMLHLSTDKTHCYDDRFKFKFDEDEQDYLADNPDRFDSKTDGEYIYDVQKCEGGHRYCNGQNNAPQIAPQNYQGYECIDVISLPDNEATNNLKSWVCKDKQGCQCGAQKCGENMACIDEKCVDVGLIPTKAKESSAPQQSDNVDVKKDDGTAKKDDDSAKSEQDKPTPRGAIYRFGCVPKGDVPEGEWDEDMNFVKTDRKYIETETGECEIAGEIIRVYNKMEIGRCWMGKFNPPNVCLCGDHNIEDIISYDCLSLDDNYYTVCVLSKGCPCGDSICPNSAACDHGQCIDPLTGQSVAESKNAPPLGCHNGNHCACGQEQCKEGEFCIYGQCLPRIDADIIGHHRVYYLMDEVQTFLNGYWGNENQYDDLLFSDISSNKHDSTSYIIDKPISDGYILMPQVICTTMHAGDCYSQSIVNHIRCNQEDGCPCGEQTCPKWSECKDNQCVFDIQYANFMCYEDDYEPFEFNSLLSESYESYYGKPWQRSFGVSVDKQGQCLCNGTMLNPRLNNHRKEMYSCTRFGWTCKLEDGCECGDIKCSQNSVCIAPGVCSDAFQCSANACQKDGVCKAPGSCFYP